MTRLVEPAAEGRAEKIVFSLSITRFFDDFFLSLWLNLCHFLLIFVIINSKYLEIWVGFRKFGRDFLGGIFSDSSDLGGILH